MMPAPRHPRLPRARRFPPDRNALITRGTQVIDQLRPFVNVLGVQVPFRVIVQWTCLLERNPCRALSVQARGPMGPSGVTPNSVAGRGMNSRLGWWVTRRAADPMVALAPSVAFCCPPPSRDRPTDPSLGVGAPSISRSNRRSMCAVPRLPTCPRVTLFGVVRNGIRVLHAFEGLTMIGEPVRWLVAGCGRTTAQVHTWGSARRIGGRAVSAGG